jgi:hypothetical protein
MHERADSHTDYSSSLDEQTQRTYDEGSLRVLETVRRLEIKDVYVSRNIESGSFDTDFTNAVRRARQWLRGTAAEYALNNRKFGKGIDKLLEDDPLTDNAKRFHWKGMFAPAKEDEAEYGKTYLEFKLEWEKEKTEVFVSLVQENWQKMKPRRGWPWYAKAAAAVLVVGAGLWLAYENYIKPDIKREVRGSMPYIPTLDEMVARFKPEIRKELDRYNTNSQDNIEKAIDSFLRRKSKENPMIGMLFPQLKKKMKKEFGDEEKVADKGK